jgi:hypothetical protein
MFPASIKGRRPRNPLNFWLDGTADGRQSAITGGTNGRMELTLKVRNGRDEDGAAIKTALTIICNPVGDQLGVTVLDDEDNLIYQDWGER